jgi:D-glycero-D-manno-heptose 1,7-bisphosphate phosphatase
VYTNKDGYTRNSISVDSAGYVSAYDKSNTTPGLQGVEISYALVAKSVLRLLPDTNVPLEAALYGRLASERQLLAHKTEHRYYSVGSLQRLPLTEAFLARFPTVFLDRDGVLNKKAPRAQYVRSCSDFVWLAGAKAALRLLKEAGYRVIVITNQAGIGRGLMTEEDLLQIHRKMREESEQAGGQIEAVYYCPHDWNEGCQCRKPKPGLLFCAQRELNLDLTRTPFVGDDERDAAAADSAGCPFFLVSDEVPLLAVAQRLISCDSRD